MVFNENSTENQEYTIKKITEFFSLYKLNFKTLNYEINNNDRIVFEKNLEFSNKEDFLLFCENKYKEKFQSIIENLKKRKEYEVLENLIREKHLKNKELFSNIIDENKDIYTPQEILYIYKYIIFKDSKKNIIWFNTKIDENIENVIKKMSNPKYIYFPKSQNENENIEILLKKYNVNIFSEKKKERKSRKKAE